MSGRIKAEKTRWYDKQGKPISMQEAAALIGNYAYRVIGQTTLKNNMWVSTVWLGLDHRFGGRGPPLIFESMVFVSRDSHLEIDVQRYTTEKKALLGHKQLCDEWEDEL